MIKVLLLRLVEGQSALMFTWFIATAKLPAIPNEPSSPKPSNPTVAEASLQELGTFKQDAPIKHSAVEDSIYL